VDSNSDLSDNIEKMEGLHTL
jgi:hypothetical protein